MVFDYAKIIEGNCYFKDNPNMFAGLFKNINEDHLFIHKLRKTNKQYKDWIDLCISKYASIIFNYKLTTKIFWIITGRTEFPKCCICGNDVKRDVYGIFRGYGITEYLESLNIFTCGNYVCSQKNPLSQKHKHDYFESKYGKGITNPFQAEEVKRKNEQTHLKNFGVKNPFQAPAIIKKIQEKITPDIRKRGLDIGIIVIKHKAYESIKKLDYAIPLFSEDEYVNAPTGTIFNWKCVECGTEFKSNYKNGKVMHICPSCKISNQSTSKAEFELAEYIRKVCGNKYTVCHQMPENSMLSPFYTVDVYIKELNLVFEYNGIFWHSIHNKSKYSHSIRMGHFERRGIKVITIWEDEWLNHNDDTKDFIADIICETFDFSKAFDLNAETLVVSRDKFNKCWDFSQFEYTLIKTTEPNLVRRQVANKGFYEIYDSGSLIYRKYKHPVYRQDKVV